MEAADFGAFAPTGVEPTPATPEGTLDGSLGRTWKRMSDWEGSGY
jgi:hypothetical protein